VGEAVPVEFYLDSLCPWAYQTSLWTREVAGHGLASASWRLFSLEEPNRPEGARHPWEREWSYGWSLMRVGALLLPHLYEVQRPKTAAELAHVRRIFLPYLEAPQWPTVTRPTP
jgi:hypothetical protein